MIRKLTIKNFKIHSNTELELSNLNILTGINGVGKSSVFQSLLLLRQSYEANVLSSGLQLNKPYCDIGFISDAIYQGGETDEIEFAIDTNENGNQSWKFRPLDKNPNKNFIPVSGSTESNIVSDSKDSVIPSVGTTQSNLGGLSVFNNNFQYLSAARLSPRETYPLDSNAVEVKRQLSVEKGQGELVVHFLYHYGKEKKEKIKFDLLRHEAEALDDLLSQTSAWEREVSPGVNVVPTPSGKAFTLKYTFNKKNDFTPTEPFSAENVGFGLSYALPIIVAALSSSENSLILVENPEAHLHPRGQSQLAKLLALAAHSGVQIIIETHSEHIINGVLVACKKFEKGEKGINKDLVRIYHFKRDEEKHCAIADRITILADGKVDRQPEDFFEQTEKDLNYLLGF
jgi:predicted ATPase